MWLEKYVRQIATPPSETKAGHHASVDEAIRFCVATEKGLLKQADGMNEELDCGFVRKPNTRMYRVPFLADLRTILPAIYVRGVLLSGEKRNFYSNSLHFRFRPNPELPLIRVIVGNFRQA